MVFTWMWEEETLIDLTGNFLSTVLFQLYLILSIGQHSSNWNEI